MRRLTRGVVSLPALVLLASCASVAGDPEAESGETAVVGGTQADGAELAAIGRVRIGGRDYGHEVCTATLVAPQLVMTAAHCRDVERETTWGGAEFLVGGKAYAVKAEITTGPSGIGYIGAGRDAALYLLESPVPASVATPIPVRARSLDVSDEGKTFTVVGFGRGPGIGKTRTKGPMTLGAVSGNPYRKRFHTEAAYVEYVLQKTGAAPTTPFDALELSANAYEVHGGLADGDATTCYGDSGGPLLDKVGDHYELVAVTTGGDEDCVLGTVFTAMGAEVQDALTRAVASPDPLAFCDVETPTAPWRGDRSRCNGSEAIRCVAGRTSSIHLDDCASYGLASTCELRATDTGARCSHAASSAAPPSLSASPRAVVQLALGYLGNACALRRSGRVDCWGNWGRIGVTAAPAPFGGLKDVVSLTQGRHGFYALRRGGEIVYWGEDREGATSELEGPSTVFTVPGAVELSGVCARTAGGTVTCFEDGPLGDPTAVPGLTGVVQLAGGVDSESVSVPTGEVAYNRGRDFTCARRVNGTVRCWGSNRYGQLGAGIPYQTEEIPVPVQVLNLTDAVDIAASEHSACAVRASGRVVCWGKLSEGTVTKTGPLAYGEWFEQPVELAGVSDAVRVSVGNGNVWSTQVCALRKGGIVTCWGDQGYHVRGVTADERALKPATDIRELAGAVSVTTSGKGTCAVMPNGVDVHCWGRGLGLTRAAFNGTNFSIPQKIEL